MDKVIIFGVGKFYLEHKDDVEEQFEIVQYIDREKEINGMAICHDLDKMKKGFKILIMVSNKKVCFEIIKELIEKNIAPENIILGIARWGDYSRFDDIYIDCLANMHIVNKGIDLIVHSEDEFCNAADTILFECYKYYLNSDNSEVVFDVGMNIADSSIYFASMPKVEKVYGFEPFKGTYDNAINNIRNSSVSHKIVTYNYGLGKMEFWRELTYGDGMSCGQSTISDINAQTANIYERVGLIDKKDLIYEKVEVKKSSRIISELIALHKNSNFILKLDCEGAEYEIFEDLAETKVIKKFSLIMLEWHYKTEEPLVNILKKNGFSYISTQKTLDPMLGVICAWKR